VILLDTHILQKIVINLQGQYPQFPKLEYSALSMFLQELRTTTSSYLCDGAMNFVGQF